MTINRHPPRSLAGDPSDGPACRQAGSRLRGNDVLETLASVKLTLVCLGFAMALVVFGTLAQVNMGTFAAQKAFFNSWFVFGQVAEMDVPLFPGGLTVGLVWVVNLLAAFAVKFKFHRHDAGILISHFGVILLMMGQFLTQTLAHESNSPPELGQTRNYSDSFRETELALVMTSNPASDEVTSIPYSLFSKEGPVILPNMPFSIVIRKFYPNAQLGMQASPQPSPDGESLPAGRQGRQSPGEALVNQGIGTRIAVQEVPPVSSDDEANAVTAYVEVLDGGKSLGTWLLSSGLGAPQSFTVQGKTYQIFIRPRRHYYPFNLTLKDFRHDIYPGTDIPKNFSSLVHLSNSRTQENRDALIYMNHPLRYEGKTFYQASFGKGDRLSVFQVVENPAFWAPYTSCALVVLGLLIQFLSHLFEFVRKRS